MLSVLTWSTNVTEITDYVNVSGTTQDYSPYTINATNSSYYPVTDTGFMVSGNSLDENFEFNLVPSVSYGLNTDENGSTSSDDVIFVNVSASDVGYGGGNVSTFVDFDNSLVSWWRMDDVDSSTVIDYMDRNNGTAIDGAVQTDDGYMGKAFVFDGDGDYVYMSSAAVSEIPAAFSAWINVADFSSHLRIITVGVEGVSENLLSLYTSTDGTVQAQHSNGTGSQNAASSAINENQWYHVVGNFVNNSYREIYINGVLNGTKDAAWDPVSGLNYTAIGVLKWGTGDLQHFNGTIDDVMVFNRSLSAVEIAGLYANASSRYLEVNYTGLSEGNHTFKAYAQDTTGNVNDSLETRTVTTQFVGVPSEYKFAVYNNSGVAVASFDDKGDLYLKGSVNEDQSSLDAPDNSFVVQNSSGTTVAYVSDVGSLFMLGAISVGDALDGSATVNFEFRNATRSLVSFFDDIGNLKLKGGYLTSYSSP